MTLRCRLGWLRNVESSPTGLTQIDVERMLELLVFEGPERGRRLGRLWRVLLLSAVVASARVVGDSTPVVTGTTNLRRSILRVLTGAASG
jgi:hypothetical protein